MFFGKHVAADEKASVSFFKSMYSQGLPRPVENFFLLLLYKCW